MAALDLAIPAKPHPSENVAAEPLDERNPLARLGWTTRQIGADRARGQTLKDLVDQTQTLLDLVDANPDTRIDVARLTDGHIKIQLLVGRVAGVAACVKAAARGAP